MCLLGEASLEDSTKNFCMFGIETNDKEGDLGAYIIQVVREAEKSAGASRMDRSLVQLARLAGWMDG